MAKLVKTFEAPIGGFYGLQLTLTNAKTEAWNIPDGAKELIAYGSAAFRMQLGPPLAACKKTTDNEATFTDYTTNAKDNSASTHVTLSSLDTAANGDYWYIASRYKFAGCWIDVDGANANASVMTGYYWNGNSWVSASITDNTAAAGKCLAADGTVTFTPPGEWRRGTLDGEDELFIIRFQVSAALDAAVTLDGVALLPDTTTYPMGYFAGTTDYILSIDPSEVGSVATTSTGVTLSLTAAKRSLYDIS